MKKTLVIYNSKYGHTKKYAQWLAEDLSADICESKNLKSQMLIDYDTLIFGGSLYAGKNRAASLLVKHFEQIKDKKVALFTCGLFDVTKKSNIISINNALDKIITPKIREKIKIFHIRGGIDYSRLNFLHRVMMKMVNKILQKKTENELTDSDKEFLSLYGQNNDFSERKMLEPIIQYFL